MVCIVPLLRLDREELSEFKRDFKTKREATEWEHHFRMKEAADLDMTFEEFVQAYTRDMKPKLKHNIWLTKEHK